MPAPIGFALLTYRAPGQVYRLVCRLRDLYGPDAPIVVHHDFDQCALEVPRFPADVAWVRPHHRMGWGVWGTVEATLAALRLLYAGEGPDHVVLLSGADYPSARASQVLAQLREDRADAYIDARQVDPWRRDRVQDTGRGLGVNVGASNQEVCFRRYYSTTYRILGLRLRIRSRLLAPLLSPFSRRFRCWAGEHWWTLGRAAVRHLLQTCEDRPDLLRWFAARQIPEEAFVHTVVCNAPALRIVRGSQRYVDWSSYAPSPRELGGDDLARILASGAHFARKFAEDAPVLDALDRALGLEPWHAPFPRDPATL